MGKLAVLKSSGPRGAPGHDREQLQGPAEIVIGHSYGGHLGDQMVLTPLPRLLSTVYSTQVYVKRAPNNLAIFGHNPYVAGFRDGQEVRFDRLVSRGQGHIIQRLQKAFGLRVDGDPRPEVYLSDEEREWSAQERAKWPDDRPVCILSTRAVSDAACYRNVDWEAMGKAWMQTCTVVQPVITNVAVYQDALARLPSRVYARWQSEEIVPGAVVYEDLALRRYMSLFSVADYFCGATSGGTHVAAAFGLPSLVIVWFRNLQAIRFPFRRGLREMFLYPQHDFVPARDMARGSVSQATLDRIIAKVRSRPAAPSLAPVDLHGRVHTISRVDTRVFRARGRAADQRHRRHRASRRLRAVPHSQPIAEGVARILPDAFPVHDRPRRRLIRAARGRIIGSFLRRPCLRASLRGEASTVGQVPPSSEVPCVMKPAKRLLRTRRGRVICVSAFV